MEDRRLKDSPDKNYILKHNKIPTDSQKVTIYRASPSDIREGDFAALNKEHAGLHIRSAIDKIFTKVVDIADLIQGWDANEVIYAPPKGNKSNFSSDARNFYDPSQQRDESGKWTGQGAGFKGKLIEKAQKQNPALDMAKSSVKGAIKGITAIADGARVATQYGASKAYQIKNWLASDSGQRFLQGVARTISIGSSGAIEAVKTAHGDRYKILVGSLFNPEIGAIVAGQSALKGFIRGAVNEYNKVENGRQVSNIVRKSVGIRPMSAQNNAVMLEKDPDMNDVADYLADNIAVAIREEVEGKKLFEVVTFYDPSQARDDSGKWTSSGGSAKGEILVSPNIKENMTYDEAVKMTDSSSHASAVSLAKDVVKNQNMEAKFETGVGDWEDGAENSIKIDVEGAKDFNQIGYTASKLGMLLKQKAVVAFEEKPDGEDTLHRISTKMGMDQVRKVLSDNGITFRTMVGDRQKTNVTILDKGSQLTSNIENVLGVINGISNATRGFGEFIGGDTRIQGQKAYRDRISEYEKQFPHRVRHKLQKGQGRNYYRSYQAIEFYDPSQQRDDSGKWSGSGGSSGSTPTPKWAQDNPAEASKKTGQATTLYHGTSADVLKDIRKDGLKPSKSGVWGGGKVYSTDSLDLAMEYGVLRSGSSPKIGGKQLIGIISVLADGFKSVADNIPTTKAQKMGKTGLNAVSKIFTKDGVVPPSAIKLMQIFEVDTIRKYVYENGPKPKPLATKQLADGSKLIYVPIVIQLPDDGSEGFQFDEAVAIESFVFQYNGEKIEFYDPSQARDENGRWSGGGSSGGLLDKVHGKISGWLEENLGIYTGEKHQYLKEQAEWAKSMAEKNIDPQKIDKIISTIRDYTGEGYSSLNFAHRKSGDTERKKQETETLDHAIEVGPKTTSDVLYRGMTQRFEFEEKGVNKVIPKESGTEKLAKNAKVGDVFEDKGFISTSEHEHIGKNFSGLDALLEKSGTVEGAIAKYTGKPIQKIPFKDGAEIKARDIRSRVFMEIVGAKGKGIKVPSFATNMDNEKEVLLPRNTKFKVLDVQRMTVIPDIGSPKGVDKGYLAKIKVQIL